MTLLRNTKKTAKPAVATLLPSRQAPHLFQKKLRIAMLASNVIRIPPIPHARYVPPGWSGAPELVVYQLTEELVRRGHEVTLFASGDSQTSAKLASVTKTATWNTVGIGPHEEYERMLISKAYHMAGAGKFDIIHSHFDIRSAYFAPLVSTPTISTLHSPLDGIRKEILPFYKRMQYYASLSNSQRKPLPDLRYAVTAYNGVDLQEIPFFRKKDDYLVFAGRIMDIKGASEAIEVAKKSGRRLFLLGTADPQSQYWKEKIEPFIEGKQVVHKGFLKRSELFSYLGRARAFVFPLKWPEPFGLVAIESMATGTPTIAFRQGSLPEIVQHGKTGYLCETVAEMVKAVAAVDQIDPAACRNWVAEMFTVGKVVDRYEQAYFAILAGKFRVTA